jgi:hypothetical protein
LNRAAPENPDLVGLVASWLRQDEAIGGFVGERIGSLGEYRVPPNYLEIGHTRIDDAFGTPGDQHLLSIHIWSRTGSPGELEELLRAAEQAIISGGNDLNPRREFSEIRYDDEQGAYHGLLRMKLLCGQGTSDEPADE